jgi:hypothetical protein
VISDGRTATEVAAVVGVSRQGVQACIAGIDGLSIDTIELYERNMIDELAPRLVHGELPVGS